MIAYDVKSSILLLAAIATEPTGPLAIVLVNISTPLLGQTPALKLPLQDDGYYRPPTSSKGSTERQSLNLERGEFVTVVGWLESDQSKLSSQVSLLTRPRKGAIADNRSIWGRLIRVLYRSDWMLYISLTRGHLLMALCIEVRSRPETGFSSVRRLDAYVVRIQSRKRAALGHRGLNWSLFHLSIRGSSASPSTSQTGRPLTRSCHSLHHFVKRPNLRVITIHQDQLIDTTHHESHLPHDIDNRLALSFCAWRSDCHGAMPNRLQCRLWCVLC